MAELKLPEGIRAVIDGASLKNISGRSSARTYLCRRGGEEFILKTGAPGSLRRQAERMRELARHGFSAGVIAYESGDCDALLMHRLAGRDGTDPKHLSDPGRLCRVLAGSLRALHELSLHELTLHELTLHELSPGGCPWDVNRDAIDRIPAPKKLRPDPAYYEAAGFCLPGDIPAAMLKRAARDILRYDAVLHGDACLPNIMMDNFAFTGFIDVGEGGVGDRHFDLFWAIWSLAYNLGTDAYREPFLDAYGRDAVDAERLRICALLSSL